MVDTESKEVGEFVMNCLTTIVVHHYCLKPKVWSHILNIVHSHAETLPYQAGVIVRKILSEKMSGVKECE